ncbi:conserved hypothetical protein [Trichinella spiralis]|uniref:hypothetical protein n=1 Tax=Trichinella spiralis TaxID=6334 RepID=UPI0001EFDA46|nr:conserved hypothetical protein [Trichinella spiralis]
MDKYGEQTRPKHTLIEGPLENARIEAGFPASQPAASVLSRAAHSETFLRTSLSHQQQCDASSPLVPVG